MTRQLESWQARRTRRDLAAWARPARPAVRTLVDMLHQLDGEHPVSALVPELLGALDVAIEELRARLHAVHRVSGIDTVLVVGRLERVREEIAVTSQLDDRTRLQPSANEVVQTAHLLVGRGR